MFWGLGDLTQPHSWWGLGVWGWGGTIYGLTTHALVDAAPPRTKTPTAQSMMSPGMPRGSTSSRGGWGRATSGPGPMPWVPRRAPAPCGAQPVTPGAVGRPPGSPRPRAEQAGRGARSPGLARSDTSQAGGPPSASVFSLLSRHPVPDKGRSGPRRPSGPRGAATPGR